jgi:hypothetical protein
LISFSVGAVQTQKTLSLRLAESEDGVREPGSDMVAADADLVYIERVLVIDLFGPHQETGRLKGKNGRCFAFFPDHGKFFVVHALL